MAKRNWMADEFEFVPDTTAFRLENAYGLARLARLAYENSSKVEKTATEWGFHRVHLFDIEDTECLIVAGERMIAVAFRGTERDIDDWLTDLDFQPVAGPLDGKVHGGFHEALSRAWQRIERTIGAFREKKEKSLWFTGHSLGGALAALAVARLLDEDLAVDGLYTFGQPRTGNRTFARNFDADFKPHAFRFVNNNDVVTRVPPRAGWHYRHAGTLRYFTEDGTLSEDMGCWNRFLDRMHGRVEDLFEWGSDGIKDHAMRNYLDLIGDALP